MTAHHGAELVCDAGRVRFGRKVHQNLLIVPQSWVFSDNGPLVGKLRLFHRRVLFRERYRYLFLAIVWGNTMSAIPPAVQQALRARNQATRQQIDTAIVRKGLDIQKQSGDAIVALLEQTAELQRQIADGYLDVKV